MFNMQAYYDHVKKKVNVEEYSTELDTEYPTTTHSSVLLTHPSSVLAPFVSAYWLGSWGHISLVEKQNHWIVWLSGVLYL